MDAAERMLAEAERLMGITGPKYTITVGGQLYRLPEQPAAAAALFSEMLYIIRHWLGEHPDAAAEMSEYTLPMNDEVKAFPLAVQLSIFLGLALDMYAHNHGGSELKEL
jgi:hypothetical protein